ncbi:hypothetical protein DPMN_143201 [Dreissena polymorpha]|uniref:Uncharacterized protein n=1 Tax=Dreissena polymorpha TaxID=45954 RepID=A0A9D4GGS0_DREPO|nr:hypothetical protein DPMN_143201 [Dreissena polymorpha]
MLLPCKSLPVPVEIDQPWLESSDDEILSDNSEECDGDQDQDHVVTLFLFSHHCPSN